MSTLIPKQLHPGQDSLYTMPMNRYHKLKQALSPTSVLAVSGTFEDEALVVQLSDGREISAPLEWFPRLRNATDEQRRNWRLIARGIGIHWEDIDEDIAVSTLLRGW